MRAIAFGVTYVYVSARSLCDCGGQNFAMDRKDMRILRAVSVEVERYRTFMACACGRLWRVHSQAEGERYTIMTAYACAICEVIKGFGMAEGKGGATVSKGEGVRLRQRLRRRWVRDGGKGWPHVVVDVRGSKKARMLCAFFDFAAGGARYVNKIHTILSRTYKCLIQPVLLICKS